MSILGSTSNTNGEIFTEFKKQASFYLKEKIKTARLALTDVTPIQLLAEEATNGNQGVPDARTLKMMSKAAFEVDDYCRIVEILHKRLVKFDKRNWRISYQALIVLEHLLTHGPERVANEFHGDIEAIRTMESFQHVDEKGFNWGLTVRKKSERVLKLLEKGPLLKEERDKARKISRGIEGFGSFNMRISFGKENLHESSGKAFDRCNSEFRDHTTNRDDENQMIETRKDNKAMLLKNPTMEKSLTSEKSIIRVEMKGNSAPDEGKWNFLGESKPLLNEGKEEVNINMNDHHHHPFGVDDEHVTTMSLLCQ